MITVIYCTSNREDPLFEAKIIEVLRQRTPRVAVSPFIPRPRVISVSQVPMDLGHNICVGDVGASYPNLYRQMLIGAEAAETSHVMFAESDQLYPPGYFDVEPGDAPLYVSRQLYILRHWDRAQFWRKEYGEMTICVKRDHVIRHLHERLKGRPVWGPGKIGEIFPKRKWQWFDAGPVVSCKTTGNLSVTTSLMKGVEPVTELPRWGRAADLSTWLWGSAENTPREGRPLASSVTVLQPLPADRAHA